MPKFRRLVPMLQTLDMERTGLVRNGPGISPWGPENKPAIIGLHPSNQGAISSRVALALARSLRWGFLRAGGVNRYGLSPLISTGV